MRSGEGAVIAHLGTASVAQRTSGAGYHDAIPVRRYGTAEEIAAAVGCLCSTQAACVNGQVLAVDGGFDAAGIGLPALRQLPAN